MKLCVWELETGEPCNSNKIENKEFCLCATHNKARIKSENPKESKPARNGLPQSRKPIRQVSSKQAVKNAQKAAAYAVVDATNEHWCVSCGEPNCLTHSHVLTEKQHEKHRANPENILLECQDCHYIWEHDKRTSCRIHPESWALKMEIMERLEPQYFQQFKNNYPDLFRNEKPNTRRNNS